LCGGLDPDTVIRLDADEWEPSMPARLDDEELADWRAGRNAIYRLAALTIGSRIAVADTEGLQGGRERSFAETHRRDGFAPIPDGQGAEIERQGSTEGV
jgi:hypothetical protein